MAYQKLQVSQGLAVIPSASVMIPDPTSQVLKGAADFSTAGVLTDVGTTFLSAGIQQGAIIYNITDQVAYYVLGITDDLNLDITSIAGGSAAADYVIYNAPTIGCVLYVGGTGNLVVQMAALKDEKPLAPSETTFQNVPASFLPIQVVRVDDLTTATDIIALW